VAQNIPNVKSGRFQIATHAYKEVRELLPSLLQRAHADLQYPGQAGDVNNAVHAAYATSSIGISYNSAMSSRTIPKLKHPQISTR